MNKFVLRVTTSDGAKPWYIVKYHSNVGYSLEYTQDINKATIFDENNMIMIKTLGGQKLERVEVGQCIKD